MRALTQVIPAHPSKDGDGVKINRLAGQRLHQVLNPFLMIDEIHSDDAADYIGGFPEHPHRGFETITYMKAGRMRHRDHMGNEGVIGAGAVQWMTAGAGVLHSEMPEQSQGLMHGFQLWLNLPAAEKMQAAAYREIDAAAIPRHATVSGGNVSVIAGGLVIQQASAPDTRLSGPIPSASTQAVIADVKLAANESLTLEFTEANPAWVFVYRGATKQVPLRNLGVYQPGDALHLEAGDTGADLLVLSGQPIQEPIVQYGPFVMNSVQEIETAISDFRNSAFIESLSSGARA
jgi:hypothetical protein